MAALFGGEDFYQFLPRRRRVPSFNAGQSVTVNQVSETDLAQPIVRAKSRAVGQTTEVDLAQPIVRLKTRAVGQPSETDLA